jgi:hypothetical protein
MVGTSRASFNAPHTRSRTRRRPRPRKGVFGLCPDLSDVAKEGDGAKSEAAAHCGPGL